MLYEYRRYDLTPGLGKLIHERFEKHTLRLWEKHGLNPVGFWNPVTGSANQLHYLLKWNSFEEREQREGAFQRDPEWIEALKAYPQLTGDRYLQLWKTTPYSPEP